MHEVTHYTMTHHVTSFRGELYACDRCGKTSSVPDAQDYFSCFLTWRSCDACRQYKLRSQQCGSLYLYWPCLPAFLRHAGTRVLASLPSMMCYFSTRVQMPAPTVRPPSRMA